MQKWLNHLSSHLNDEWGWLRESWCRCTPITVDGRACCYHLANTVEQLCTVTMCVSVTRDDDMACSQIPFGSRVITHTHTTVLLLFWNMSGTTRVSRYQKGNTRQVKTNLDLLEQEIVSGSGICWAICKVCTSSQTTTPTSHHSVFTGRMPFLSPNQQRQSTEVLLL